MSKSKKSVASEMTETVNNETTKEKIMSKPEETTTKTEAPELQEYSVKYRYFDLGDLKMKATDIPIKFQPAATWEEAVERLGSDTKILTTALNSALQRQVEQDARKSVTGVGVPKKVVMDFIKSWRMGKPFSDIVTTEKGKDKNWKEQYDAQTDAILAEVTKHEFLVNSIKANAANFAGDDSDDE